MLFLMPLLREVRRQLLPREGCAAALRAGIGLDRTVACEAVDDNGDNGDARTTTLAEGTAPTASLLDRLAIECLSHRIALPAEGLHAEGIFPTALPTDSLHCRRHIGVGRLLFDACEGSGTVWHADAG